MKTTARGAWAETAVAKQLTHQGYRIIAQNWKTSRCEIDIVASQQNIVYFVEVKYRADDDQGDGFEYITPAKIRQMKFAARIWSQQNSYDGDYRLLAVAVSGLNYQTIELIELE